jgi:rhamnan synthesis protein F
MIKRLADIYDRIVQKLVLAVFYYIPIARSYLTPNQRDSDIRDVHAGNCSFATGRYAIYVLWQPKTIPWYVLNMLEALKRHQVNTIVVSNETLSAEQLATLKPLCAEVLVRGNKGLDFGAYKDAVLRRMKDKSSISRLLFLNDSVYVFRRGLDDLLDALLSEDTPIVAAHENWEKHYHFQSFCLGLSGELLRDPKVEKFWRQYRPISIRRWCIDEGEVKFSETLRKVATRFHVVYRINDLLDLLGSDREIQSLLLYREFVPKLMRKAFPDDEFLEDLKSADPALRNVILKRTKERISNLLIMGSQVHSGAFFFPKFLGSPLVKRDLVFREQFNLYEVERMLSELGVVEELPMIADDIRRRGTGGHLKGLKRRRYRLGLI